MKSTCVINFEKLFSILGHKERIRKVFRTKKFFFDVKNLEAPQIKQLAKDLITLGGVSTYYKTQPLARFENPT